MLDVVMVDIEFAGEQSQKTLAPGCIQRQIGTTEISRPSARGNLATAPVETAEHLLMKPVGIVTGKLGPRSAGQHAARGFGDLAPCAAQVGQRPVEDAFEETGGSAVGHGCSCGAVRSNQTRLHAFPSIPKSGRGRFTAAAVAAIRYLPQIPESGCERLDEIVGDQPGADP